MTSERLEARRKEREDCKNELETKHFGPDVRANLEKPLAQAQGSKKMIARLDKLFDLAWEYGHSAGLGDVGIYYGDLADLVK